MASCPVFITAAEAACAIGDNLAECHASISQGVTGLRPLAEHLPLQGLETLLAGWLRDRSILLGRHYGVATNAALNLGRRAVAQAGWTKDECESAWIFAGTSRGNAAELLGHTAFRRPVKRFAASNTLPSEIPAALSIELGMRGPWQLLSNACAAGLDALGLAWQAVSSGLAPRALVVGVELPLVPELLRSFQDSGLLARTTLNQPYHHLTDGLNPAEAVAAITLESTSDKPALAEMAGYWTSSDAYHTLSVPEDGHGIRACLEAAAATFPQETWGGICPHATGTAAQGSAEQRMLAQFLKHPLPLSLLKPFTGHSLGASGLLEVALLVEFMKRNELPPNLPEIGELAAPVKLMPGQLVLKAASGMGGHNALVALRSMPVAGTKARA